MNTENERKGYRVQIPHYKIFVHPIDFRDLRKDIWIDAPVMAKMTIDKKKYEIDLAYRGSHIREFPKKSYHLSFYKPPLFRGVKEVHLNAEYKDPSFIRNKLSFDFFEAIGCLSPKSEFVFLTINGKKEGVYLQLESVDEYFLTSRSLPKGAIYYAIDGDANFSLMSDIDQDVKKSLMAGYERKVGMETDDAFLQAFIMKINTIPREEFEQEIQKMLQVDKYLRWLAGVVCTQNFDGFVHNYALYRNAETGLFEVIPWDYDATWGRDIDGIVMEEDYVRIEGFNTLTARILDVPEFRKQYKKLLEDILENVFNEAFLKPKIEEMQDAIRPYLAQDPYRNQQMHMFDEELAFICQFIKDRGDYIRSQLGNLEGA
ncbi:CotH kinase family protein [Sporosarcina sp. HYO08]|uniref:CotH kinase family protein n=1 Tax=Sporosarcina sp. HYO08 TaxID=1759557 RepID=UPI000793BE3B|nr:CotH kinase family protein [Sporosarcina sp. HYO08]KXH84129.1 spore coat protein [Sporosarcina sp. HYO08]